MCIVPSSCINGVLVCVCRCIVVYRCMYGVCVCCCIYLHCCIYMCASHPPPQPPLPPPTSLPTSHRTHPHHPQPKQGTEQALTGDIMGGWALLNAVAGAHQREGWTLLLGHTLQHMLTIAQQASWSHATVCLSLHLAALPQVLDVDQRRALTRDAWSTLTAASSRKGGDGGGGDIGGNSGGMGASAHSGPLSAAAATDDPWAPVPGSSSVLVISPTHAGLCCVLPMAVGFAPMAAHDTQLLMGM